MQPAYCFCTKTRYNGSVKTCRTTQKRKGKIKLKKRLLSILLTALLLCAVLLVLVDTAWAAETLDCTVGVAAGKINPAYTGYVNRAMRYYIRNVSALSNVPDGQSILFFFEGVSAVASPNYKADDYTQSAVRNAAVCLAVKFVNGTPEIYYCEDQCSTFPDMPLEFSYKGNGYSPSTIYDGIYKVRLDNHLSGSKEDYAALTLDMSNNYLTGAKTNAFYLCDNDKRGTGKPFTNSQITSGNRSYQIHGHAGKTATQSNSFRWSVGCILAGATYGEFSALMAGITGDSSLSSAGKPPLLSEGQKRDFGYVVIDRSQYTTQLQEVYTGSGSYTKNGTTAYYNITSADARDAIHELCRGSLGIDFGGGTTGDVIDSGNCGANSSNVTWKLTSDGTLTISGKGKMADYEWNAPWYDVGSQVKKAVIEDGVTSIGSYAFCWCENLTSVTIPNSVTSIGDNAFYWCTSLTSVTIPYGVKDIGAYAFGFCKELSSVTIPSSVTTIGSSAFSNCTSLTSVTIPDGVTTISESAFESCSSLTSVTIPNSVTSIGDGAFWCCTNLTSVTIPRSVTSIGSGAFQYCSSLTSVTIPNSVTSIGGGAFGGSGLTSVTIPDTVTVIGDGVFRGCSRLSGVTIPDSVTSIGSFAFSFCDSLTNVTIPKSMTRISENAFCACLNMTDVYYAGTASDWAKITIEEGNEPLTSATLHCAKSAPTAPVVKLGNSATSGKPMLTWNAVYGATSYRIYRSTSRGSGYSLLGTTTATSYTNTGAKAGTTYYYKVKAVNSAGESAYSNIVSGRATVTTLTMGHSSTSGKPQLTWKAVSGAVSYKVYRATAKNGAYTVINTTKALTYTNVGAALGTTYYYKVEALNAAGKSLGFSAVVEGKVAPVLAVGYSSVSGKPQLTWKAVPGATEYQVYRSTQQNSGYSKINTTTSTSYVNTGAKAGTTYYYRIVAVKGTAASDFSNIVSARPSK